MLATHVACIHVHEHGRGKVVSKKVTGWKSAGNRKFNQSFRVARSNSSFFFLSWAPGKTDSYV